MFGREGHIEEQIKAQAIELRNQATVLIDFIKAKPGVFSSEASVLLGLVQMNHQLGHMLSCTMPARDLLPMSRY